MKTFSLAFFLMTVTTAHAATNPVVADLIKQKGTIYNLESEDNPNGGLECSKQVEVQFTKEDGQDYILLQDLSIPTWQPASGPFNKNMISGSLGESCYTTPWGDSGCVELVQETKDGVLTLKDLALGEDGEVWNFGVLHYNSADKKFTAINSLYADGTYELKCVYAPAK